MAIGFKVSSALLCICQHTSEYVWSSGATLSVLYFGIVGIICRYADRVSSAAERCVFLGATLSVLCIGTIHCISLC